MLPNVTDAGGATRVEPYKEGSFDAYVTYCALGGILTEDDGETHRMSVAEFCQAYSVSKMTLSRWKKQTPDWAARVQSRRNEIMPLARVTAVWNNMYLIARQSKDKRSAVEAGKLFLGHNGLQLPVQRQDVRVEGGFLDLMTAATKEGVIEGEIVDADPEPQTDAGGEGQDTGALSPAS